MTALSRRTLLIVAALGLAGVSPADAQWGEPHRMHRRNRGDHDCARRALEEGRAKPLAEILPAVESELGGQAIEIELEHCSDRIVYEIKVLRPDGRLVEAKAEAVTGKIIERDD
jgi:uncharacterized membrane protein YkoI